MSTVRLRKIKDQIAPPVPDYISVTLEANHRAAATMADAEDVARQIRRHVDGVASVTVITASECRYCSRDPEFDDKEGPCCCTQAQQEWARLTAEATP